MKKKLFLVLPAVIALFIFSFSSKSYTHQASGGIQQIEAVNNIEEIKLLVGDLKVFPVDMPKRIAIGSPEVIDISNVSEKEIVLAAKAQGRSTFVYWDNAGEHSLRLRVVSDDLDLLKKRIDDVLLGLNFSTVHTTILAHEDKIWLDGELKTKEDKERVFTALGELKDKVVDLIKIREEETIVDIDVEVLEVSRDAAETLGFTMPGAISATEPSTRFSKVVRGSMDAIFHVFEWPRDGSFTMQIDALVQQGKARILSQPRLACQSGKQAELLVGGEKPVFTTQVASVFGEGTDVSYKEYGIKLNIKPTVTPEKRIKVVLNVEVSEVGTAETIGSASSPTAKAYPITKRTVSTEVFLDNSQTLGIGGLVKQKDEEDIRKVAFLGDIPLLGALFRKRTKSSGGGSGERGNIELVILLTPKIVSGQAVTAGQPQEEPAQAEEVTAPVEEEAASPPHVTSKEKEDVVEQEPLQETAAEEEIPEEETNKQEAAAGQDTLEENSGPHSLSEYVDSIKRIILAKFTYPSFAKDANIEGTVRLNLHLSSSGELLEVLLKESSGYKALDDYAIAIIKEVPAYPPFPSTVDLKELWVEIPVMYKLE